MPTVTLDQLIARAQTRSFQHTCRIAMITGDAATYIQRLDQIELEKPKSVNRAQVHRDLVSEFGEDLHVTSVQDHFNRVCACGR